MASGSTGGLDFGRSYIINPTEVHKATIIWFHDIGRTGSDSKKAVKNLRNPNIKWICPTAPKRLITSFGGKKTRAWFDVYTQVSEGMQDDLDSLNYVTTYVTRVLSSEPLHVRRGVGGIGMGAAQALFCASAYLFGNGPIDLNIVIGINGWLPNLRSLRANMDRARGSTFRVATLRTLITHGISKDNISTTFPQRLFVANCVDSLRLVRNQIWFKPCGGIQAMNEIRTWLVEHGLAV